MTRPVYVILPFGSLQTAEDALAGIPFIGYVVESEAVQEAHLAAIAGATGAMLEPRS